MENEQSLALESIFSQTFLMLEDAARKQESPLRLAVLATTDQNGKPNARTVVVRSVDKLQQLLYVNTDRRSPKYIELLRHPVGVFVLYDPVLRVQLRVMAEISFHEDGEVKQNAWAELSMEGRSVYMTEAPPGEQALMATSGLPSAFRHADPGTDNIQRGYGNFVVMEAKAVHMDWLSLAETGHRRADFTWKEERRVEARWLYP